MSEGIFTMIGALIGFFGAVITARIGRNKDLTESDIKSAIEGADRQIYKEVETLNRQLKKEISDENLKFQKEWEQKKINADLISKSRIKWIDDTKKLTSEYITDSTNLFTEIHAAIFLEKNYYQKSLENKDNKEMFELDPLTMSIKNDIGRRKIIQNELMEKLILKSTLIRLQFSDNDENNKVVDEVMSSISVGKKFINEISSLDTFKRSDLENITIFSEYEKLIVQLNQENYQRLEKLTNLLREYFKNEWEKAKLGE
ncbi:hypothetical protein JNUCC83_04690 [Vagococcus sp. JNUCC 83]